MRDFISLCDTYTVWQKVNTYMYMYFQIVKRLDPAHLNRCSVPKNDFAVTIHIYLMLRKCKVTRAEKIYKLEEIKV